MRKDTSPICVQSKTFALHMVGLYRLLSEEKKEFVLSKQVLRSGTSIGANVHEAVQAQSRADFLSKLSIALKEASETEPRRFMSLSRIKRHTFDSTCSPRRAM